MFFIPLPKSNLIFEIDKYRSTWISNGFEVVGNERCIGFYSKKMPKNFKGDYLHLWLREPVRPKLFTEKNSRIDFMNSKSEEPEESIFNLKDSRTKIKIKLKKWSDKPRGLIEGDIQATLYDFKGKEYKMTGYFKAYQALGTVNSFH